MAVWGWNDLIKLFSSSLFGVYTTHVTTFNEHKKSSQAVI